MDYLVKITKSLYMKIYTRQIKDLKVLKENLGESLSQSGEDLSKYDTKPWKRLINWLHKIRVLLYKILQHKLTQKHKQHQLTKKSSSK